MDALTAKVRDALIAEGASLATAEILAVDFVEKSRRKVEQDRRDNLAQRLLPFGRGAAAERIGCHPNAVYVMAKRGREKFSSESPEPIDAPA